MNKDKSTLDTEGLADLLGVRDQFKAIESKEQSEDAVLDLENKPWLSSEYDLVNEDDWNDL